jgi:hypothetical protein
MMKVFFCMLCVSCTIGTLLQPFNLTFLNDNLFVHPFDAYIPPKPTFQYTVGDGIDMTANAIRLSVPPVTPWSEFNSLDTLRARTHQQAMAMQTDLLRTHVVRWLYACTTGEMSVPFPPFATDASIAAVRLELFEHGYSNRVDKNAFIITVPKPAV